MGMVCHLIRPCRGAAYDPARYSALGAEVTVAEVRIASDSNLKIDGVLDGRG